MSDQPDSRPYWKRRSIWGWALYDFANTSFTVIVVTVAWAVYFRNYVAQDATVTWGGQEREAGDLLWSVSRGVSLVIVGLLSPLLGAMADHSGRKKFFIALHSLLCIVPTMMLMGVGRGEVAEGMFLFILANIGFQGALSFYDAMLPGIAKPEEYGRVSGFGFAVGYVGAMLTLALAMPFALKAKESGDLADMAGAFPASAVFFLVFAIPFFLMVPEKPGNRQLAWAALAREGYGRVRATLGHLRKYPELLKYLGAYFFYIDGLNTVISFGAIFASTTLGFSMVDNIIFFAVMQVSAILGSLTLGHLADKIGDKPTIQITLIGWLMVVVAAYFTQTKGQFYGVGFLAGAMMGATQSASRTLMGHLTPRDRTAEFFGFFSFYGKLSAVLGPLVFGAVSTATGNQRQALLSVGIFFIIGMALLGWVRVAEGRRQAGGGSEGAVPGAL